MSRFMTALACMDGRVLEPLHSWLKDRLKPDYIDWITEPGIDHLFCSEDKLCSQVRKKIAISTEKHGSKTVILTGHHDCAGNPISDDGHRQEIIESLKKLKTLYPKLRLLGLFLAEDFATVEVLYDSQQELT